MKDTAFGIDFNNEWKIITVFIGGNDLCGYCHDRALYSPSNYIAKIRDALDTLHAQVPKAFVNIVQIFDITPLSEVSHGNFFCNFITNMVCDCAKNIANHAELTATSLAYQREIENLVASGRYDTRSDFTVVLQPFFKNTEPVRLDSGKHDLAYFAPDCFHFSSLGTNAAGKSLWDNMLEPVGSKQTVWHLDSQFHCPAAGLTADQGVFKTTKN